MANNIPPAVTAGDMNLAISSSRGTLPDTPPELSTNN
jgi:hypothetical protein